MGVLCLGPSLCWPTTGGVKASLSFANKTRKGSSEMTGQTDSSIHSSTFLPLPPSYQATDQSSLPSDGIPWLLTAWIGPLGMEAASLPDRCEAQTPLLLPWSTWAAWWAQVFLFPILGLSVRGDGSLFPSPPHRKRRKVTGYANPEIPARKEWLVKTTEFSHRAKLTCLIRGKISAFTKDWKPFMNFLLKMAKALNGDFWIC